MKQQPMQRPSVEGFRTYAKLRALLSPNARYKYFSMSECACGQYLKSIKCYHDDRPYWGQNPDLMCFLNHIAGREIHTWSALAQRLEEVKITKDGAQWRDDAGLRFNPYWEVTGTLSTAPVFERYRNLEQSASLRLRRVDGTVDRLCHAQ